MPSLLRSYRAELGLPKFSGYALQVAAEHRVRELVVVLAVALAIACSRPPPDATPEGALRLWIERMDQPTFDTMQAQEAYALLGPETRANLEERAGRASRAQGRHLESYEMLALGRFGLKFRPASMHAQTDGDSARVEVVGDDPTVDHATVRMKRESGTWKVELDLVPLPPVQRRPGSDGPN